MSRNTPTPACLLLTRVAGLLLVLVLLPSLPFAAEGPADPVAEAQSLARRVLGEKAGNLVFAKLANAKEKDVFEIAAAGGKIVIRGNSGIDLASGLNWYLKHYCNSQFTLIDEHIDLPGKFPVPTETVRIQTPYRYRYFFNICTFSYTMAWWNWKEWERMIDWMAMNGVNLPLAVTGQEEVWYRVYKELGLTDQQIGEFLAGPAYLPWGWMGNIDGFGGTLSESWRKSHAGLQQKILARERALGMTPVLMGFTGHVPASLPEKFPGISIHRTGNWSAGFGGTVYLDPDEELFRRIGKLFIEKQTELFGTDHYYSADCFNEVNPDSDDPKTIGRISRNVYRAMSEADPEAVWVLQGWFLHYQKDFWKEPQAKAFLHAVPDDKMLVLDLWSERFPEWSNRSGFYGKPWIWNVLYNFGGRTAMHGHLEEMSSRLGEVTGSRNKGKFSGIGMTMEYFGNNPVVEEFVMDHVWEQGPANPSKWIREYVIRRYGGLSPHAEKAWQYMLKTVYHTHAQTGTFLCERPGFYDPKLSYRSSPVPKYSQDTLVIALEELLAGADLCQGLETYRFDLVNLARQVLSPLALTWIRETEKAYQAKDTAVIRKYRMLFLGLINDMDDLLATRKEYLLGTWLESAKSWGTTPDERGIYLWDARNLITLWGGDCTEGEYDDLNNYALKQWSGMFRSYYLPRWTKFFDQLEKSLKEGKTWDRKAFYAESCKWEKSWSRGREVFPATPKGEAVEKVKELWAKYRSYFTNR